MYLRVAVYIKVLIETPVTCYYCIYSKMHYNSYSIYINICILRNYVIVIITYSKAVPGGLGGSNPSPEMWK